MRTIRTFTSSGTRAALSVLAASSLLLSACTDSTKDEGPGSTTTADAAGEETRTVRGITDDSIKVGGITFDTYFGDAAVGVRARLAIANDADGVHGRTIELVEVVNDNNEATKGQEAVQRLVEQEGVFALLPVMSGAFGGSDYIAQNNIPTFGWGIHPAFCDQPMSFGITGCVTHPSLKVGSNALGTVLEQQLGGTESTIALLGEDTDSGKGGIVLLGESVKNVGFEVVLEDSSIPAPPDVLGDPSPFVSKVLSADGGAEPDVVYLVSSLSGTSIANALIAAGYKGMIVTPSYSPLLLNVPGYDGTWVNTQVGMNPTTPANIEMIDAVRAVAPDQQLNLAVAAGYWAADMFVKGLEATGADLTVERFLATLNGGSFTYEVPGVVGRSTWPENHGRSVPCAALTEVKNKEFVEAVPLTCGENFEVE